MNGNIIDPLTGREYRTCRTFGGRRYRQCWTDYVTVVRAVVSNHRPQPESVTLVSSGGDVFTIYVGPRATLQVDLYVPVTVMGVDASHPQVEVLWTCLVGRSPLTHELMRVVPEPGQP